MPSDVPVSSPLVIVLVDGLVSHGEPQTVDPDAVDAIHQMARRYSLIPATRQQGGLTLLDGAMAERSGSDDPPWAGAAYLGEPPYPFVPSILTLLEIYEVGPARCVVIGDRSLPVTELQDAGFRSVVVAEHAVRIHELESTIDDLFDTG